MNKKRFAALVPRKWEYYVLACILIVGLWFRSQGSLHGTFAYTYDVGRDLLAVDQIVNHHRIPLIGPTTGAEGVFYGPWWYYILTVPFIFSRGNPVGVSFFMAILGTCTAGIAYLVGKRINGKALGLVFASLVSFSPIMISSQIWNPYLALPFIVSLFYALSLCYDEKEKRKPLLFFLAGLCLGFIFDSEIFFGMIFTLGTFLGMILTFRRKLTLKFLLFLALGFITVLVPRIIFDLRHGFLITKHFIATFTHGIPQTHYTPFLSRISFLKDVLLQLWNTTIANNIPFVGYPLLIITFCIFIFFFKKGSAKERNFTVLTVTILLTFFIYFSTNSTDIFSHFIVGIPLLLLFLFSLALSFTRKIRYGNILLVVIVVITICVNLSPKQLKNNVDDSWVGDASVYRNELAAVDYIYHQAQGRSFRIQVFTPNGVNETYTYLFLWYGNSAYHYLPIETAKLGYFLIEPDTQYNNYRQKIWLDEHKKDGKVISETRLKGDILIQTRSFAH